MRVKYVRWSTLNQTGARQLLDSKDYDLVLQEQISGSTLFADRPKGRELLKLITTGKVSELHVEELTRLGRNANDTVNTLQLCQDNNVNVVVKNMGLHSIVDGKTNSIFKIVTYLLSAVGEQERENIRERTQAGTIAAKNKGVVFGRPKGTNENLAAFLAKDENKRIAKYLKEGRLTIREIADSVKASPTTVVKVKKAMSA